MKVKTSELTGVALDWAVAKCEGEVTDLIFDGITWGFKLDGKLKVLSKGWAQSMIYLPSTEWAQGGPIIEREGILVGPSPFPAQADSKFAAGLGCDWDTCSHIVTGRTPLEAAMQCFVAANLGEEVDIPEELE